MSTSPRTAPSAGSLEALRRLKETETATEDQLRTAIAEGAERLKRLRESAEESVRAARAAADRAAAAALEVARVGVAAEVAAIVRAGEDGAAKVGGRTKGAFAALQPKLLDAVLGEFRSD